MIEQLIKLMWPSFTKDNYNEDCLYLNVHAPAQNDSQNTKYPVMVYIHGGAFLSGSNILSTGLVLAQYGVVVVAVQYRLGALGFMTTGDSAAPGNFGMLDQVQALKWVRDNIQGFGGDPNKVTILGLSAGGASVGLQLLSPLSKDLFHGAISESGVDLAPWVVSNTDKAVARTVQAAREIGCHDSDTTKLIDCLRSKDASSFITLNLLKRDRTNSYDFPWNPTVDKSAGDDAFLLDYPHNLRRTGNFNKVPLMAGFMTEDGAFFLADLSNVSVSMPFFKLSMKNYAMRGLNATKDKELIGMVQNALEFQYTPWGETADPSERRMAIADVLTDSWFSAPTVQSCMYHSSQEPTYLFEFNYRTKYSKHKWMGPTHTDNFIFVFGLPFFNISGPPDTTDKNVSDLVMKLHTNFAKLGNPTPDPLSNGVQWVAFNSTSLAYLRIQPDPELKKNFQPHRMAFWNVYHHTSKGHGTKSGAERIAPLITIMLFFIGVTCSMFG